MKIEKGKKKFIVIVSYIFIQIILQNYNSELNKEGKENKVALDVIFVFLRFNAK